MRRIIIILVLCISSSLIAYSQQDSIYRDVSELKKNIIKIKPSSFVFGYTQITYERNLSPRRSFEIGVGIIGLGYDALAERDPKGFAVRGGYKFYFGKREVKHSFMKGVYLMPELAFTMYDKNVRVESDWDIFHGIIKSSHSVILDEDGKPIYDRYRKYYVAAIANVGYQWNIHRFVIDWNIGLGLGYYNKTRSYSGFIGDFGDNQHHFGFRGGNDGETYGVFNLNLKIGYLF